MLSLTKTKQKKPKTPKSQKHKKNDQLLKKGTLSTTLKKNQTL